MKKRLLSAGLLLALLFAAGCSGPGAEPGGSRSAGTSSGPGTASDGSQPAETSSGPEAVTFTDALGKEFTLDKPRRVAAMIGSFADVWCLAGGQDTLVAAANDSWTAFDLPLGEEVVNLGSSKEPNVELILGADPDFILASSNTAANLELRDTFEQSGIPTAYFDILSFDDYLSLLDLCTRLTGHPENYETYGTAVKARVESALARQDDSHPTVLNIRASGSKCAVKGSEGNVLGEMLAEMGCVNVADRDSSLLEDLSLEAIIQADPDYIFAVLQGADAADAMETLESTLLSNPAWSSLRAVREGHFYTMEHRLYNLKPNALWGEASEKLADILYGG